MFGIAMNLISSITQTCSSTSPAPKIPQPKTTGDKVGSIVYTVLKETGYCIANEYATDFLARNILNLTGPISALINYGACSLVYSQAECMSASYALVKLAPALDIGLKGLLLAIPLKAAYDAICDSTNGKWEDAVNTCIRATSNLQQIGYVHKSILSPYLPSK